MKIAKTISSIISMLVAIVFLAASTGITIICHHCESCGDFSVRAGIFLEPVEPEDDCCEAADHCSDRKAANSESDRFKCCHFSIEKLKLTNFAANGKISVKFIGDSAPILLSDYSPDYCSRPETISITVRNKHGGGRDIISFHCQLLS